MMATTAITVARTTPAANTASRAAPHAAGKKPFFMALAASAFIWVAAHGGVMAQDESFAIDTQGANEQTAPIDVPAPAEDTASEDFAIEETAPEAAAEAPIADDAQNNSAKFELAKEIIRLSPIEGPLNQTIEDLSLKVSADKRILFKSIINRSIKVDRLNAAAELAFVEIFTLEELKAMREYYASEAGKSIRVKMPLFEERVNPVIRSMIEDALFNVQNSHVNFSGGAR